MNPKLHWHPAFIEIIKLELEEYQDYLEFLPEYPLTSEPLRIDCVIIKKTKDVVIKKNLAVIFREINLLEYKSPDDYVSIEDFYKVYAYACLYASFEKVPMTSLTISFVESHYPENLLKHLREIRSYAVEESSHGIYTVIGDILPIQVIDSRKLSADENLWLKSLSNRLDSLSVSRIINEAAKRGKSISIRAFMNVIFQANALALKEAMKMGKAAVTLDEVLIESGLVAKWEERNGLKIAQNMIDLGLPLETIVSSTELDPEKVKELYQDKH